MEDVLSLALRTWNSPEFQALLSPFRTLSSISAMFWMLSRLADLALAVAKRLVFDEVGALLSVAYAIALSAGYAAMMFYTALQGQWHPSLFWREVCGFAFMYVMLGVTFTDLKTRRLKPHTTAGFFIGVLAYLFLARAPGLARQPALADFYRVLELFAAGGWGYVMTGITAVVAAWSLLSLAVTETAFHLSGLLYRLGIIKAMPVRFDFSRPGGAAAPSLASSLFILTLLAGAAGAVVHMWPRIREAGGAAVPAIQSRAQSPEAAAAAAKLRRVLPAVSFTAVSSLPRQGAIADLAVPVFRKLLDAPGDADRWLAAAALDRMDPSFSISREDLFRSTVPAALTCAAGGATFEIIYAQLPAADPARARTWWIADGRGVHFTGIGPGDFNVVEGSSACAAAAFPVEAGSVLLAFTEAPKGPGDVFRLWLSAYDAGRREVTASVSAAAGQGPDFDLSQEGRMVVMADAPGPVSLACSADCGKLQGRRIVSVETRPLAEYRGAFLRGGVIRTTPLSRLTYEKSGLGDIFTPLSLFEAALRFDPAAGFLNRWYRLAELDDGRRCVSVALDPALPGLEDNAAWACSR